MSAIERVRGGDTDAYAEIVRAHQAEVRRIVAFSVRDFQATEELVQQVFVNAYMGLDGYERGRDFGAWLRSIARNLVRDEARRAARERRRLRAYHERLSERLRDDEEHDRRHALLRDALAKCREKLGEDARRALDLRYRRALGFGEVAEALGRTVAATRRMLSRVRAALRSCIEGRMVRS
ncbi:MAG: sigma-70 family RNA polymerase sigma factor [Planctomycetota bacterium]|jgi:RNA polymerase sigma-70 factor (ECF subfamily)